MNRRIWIKEIIVVAGGVSLIPACLNEEKKIGIQLKNFALENNQAALLASLVETIIPTNSNPNEKDMNIHLFVLKMMDDCYEKQEQDKFTNGLKKFDGYSKQIIGNAFSDSPTEKKLACCKNIANEKNGDKDIQYFLNTTKSLTILGYTQSKYFMTKIIPYELIPGRFNGCVKANSAV